MAATVAEAVKKEKWTSRDITRALVRDGSPFHYRQNYVCVPNVSFGFLSWEADLLVCSKAGFLSEVEIKVSATDWKNDRLKDKWKPARMGGPRSGWEYIKNFFYAAPLPLALRWQEFGIPEYAGVYGMKRTVPGTGIIWAERVRQAKPIPGHRRLTDAEMAKLARLAALRIWTMPEPQKPAND